MSPIYCLLLQLPRCFSPVNHHCHWSYTVSESGANGKTRYVTKMIDHQRCSDELIDDTPPETPQYTPQCSCLTANLCKMYSHHVKKKMPTFQPPAWAGIERDRYFFFCSAALLSSGHTCGHRKMNCNKTKMPKRKRKITCRGLQLRPVHLIVTYVSCGIR